MQAFIKPTFKSAKERSLSQRMSQWLAKTLTNQPNFSSYLEPLIQLIKPQWRIGLSAARVITIREENANIYTLVLKPDNSWKGFKAGQYVMLHIEMNGRLLTRTFSISSSPNVYQQTGLIELSIRIQDKGLVTPWLKKNLIANHYVHLSEAMGDFTFQGKQSQHVFIAGGSGLTPIRSILNERSEQQPLNATHLYFYVRNEQELFFLDELRKLETKGLNLHLRYSDETGNFSEQELNKCLNNLESHAEFYICGPSGMISLCSKLIEAAGIPKEDIYYEYFGKAPTQHTIELETDQDFIQVDYLDSRKQVSFSAGSVNKTLLELAEEEGLKPVSGCRMGICHQCICKKKQGRVFNTKTGTYSDTGAEDIQLCLSIPVGHVELEL